MSTRDDINEATSEQSAGSFMVRLTRAIWRFQARREVQREKEALRMALDTKEERDQLLDDFKED